MGWKRIGPRQRWRGGESALIRMTRKVAAALFFLTCFDSMVIWVHAVSKKETDQHLEMGMQLLAKGQYSDALSHFHSAIDADPSHYLSYYKRATVFLALSRSRPALADLDKVIQMKPDFDQARVKRGSVLLKMGRLDEAHIDFENVLRRDPGHDEAAKHYTAIEPLKRAVEDAHTLMRQQNYQPVVDRITEIIEQVPWDPVLREMRSEAHMNLGNTVHAISDLKAATKLTNDNTAGLHKLALLHYQLGEAEEALMQIRECLKLDPEHKDCYPFYKKLKKVAKFLTKAQEAQNLQDWSECVDNAHKVLTNEPTIERVRFHAHERLCHCQLNSGQHDMTEARKSCTNALNILEEPLIYCDRADAYLNDDMFDEAVSDFRKALDLDENFQRAKEGLNKAQSRQKQAKKRDYYKILGVKRTATKREVTKAYRKLAQKWHPDNFQDEEEKKSAEKKFMDLAAAKEVLSDEEMRRKYDAGEDPLDPEAQQKSGFHPFQQGGQQFFFRGGFPGGGFPGGGGGGGFRFHFDDF